jgi:Uma2 family endonuclease
MADMAKTKITAQEFSELPEQPGFPIVELIDGEIILSASPVPRHQIISFRIGSLIDNLRSDGQVIAAPMDVYLDEFNTVEPDLMWISTDREAIIGEVRIMGAPDLLVEIFSPSTMKRDKIQKFNLYEKFGVREYWMVDLETEQVEVWVNSTDGFSRLGLYGKTGTFMSPVLGQSVDLTPVFR